MSEPIYLDNAATVARYTYGDGSKILGNPNSVHKAGENSKKVLNNALQKICKYVDCEPDQLLITSGATEAIHIAMESWAEKNGTDGIIVSNRCHNSAVEYAEKMREIHSASRKKIAFEIHTNNELGWIHDDYKKWLEDYDALFLDTTATISHEPFSFKESGVDFACCSGHKFGAPIGIGFLLHKEPLADKFSVRGTPPESLVRQMADCLTAYEDNGFTYENQVEHYNRFVEGVTVACPNAINLHASEYSNGCRQSPYIAAIAFQGISNGAMVQMLSAEGVYASTGSACQSGLNKPSRVMMAEGVPESLARSAVRFSFSGFEGLDDIDRAVEIIEKCNGVYRGVW